MATWNTGNYDRLTKSGLDATSSREFSQIVPPRSPLSVLEALGVCPCSSAHCPRSHWKGLCTKLSTALHWELLQSRAWLSCGVLSSWGRLAFYSCCGVFLLRPVAASGISGAFALHACPGHPNTPLEGPWLGLWYWVGGGPKPVSLLFFLMSLSDINAQSLTDPAGLKSTTLACGFLSPTQLAPRACGRSAALEPGSPGSAVPMPS